MKINERVEDFETEIFHSGEKRKIKFSDYRGKWVVLFFYPADFSFVCPTELKDLADNYEKFKELGVEVLSVSTDTIYVHKAWHNASDTIKQIRFPMIADPSGKISRAFGIYVESEGTALRGTFIIDPDGALKAFEVHDNGIGRNSQELLRKIQAAQYVREHGGEVCPANWKPGEKTLVKGLDLVGKL